MLRYHNATHALWPFARIFFGTGNPGFTRLLHDAMFRRYAVLAINDNTQRLTQVLLRVKRLSIGIQFVPAHGHSRIVSQNGFTAGEDSMALRAKTLHIAPCLGRGDPLAFTVCHRRTTVQRGAQLKLDIREPGAHALQKAFVDRFGVLHHQPMTDVNAFLLQAIQTASGNLRIRILHRCHHAGNPRSNQRVAARWGTPVVAAGLQRHVGGGTACLLACHPQRMDLGVRLAGTIVEPLPHDLAIFNDHAPDVRIGMGSKTPALRQLHGSRHVNLILHELNPVSGRSLRQTL